jgi:Gpi18-like mannosyltransferase
VVSDLVLAGLILSNLFYLGACYFLYRLARIEGSEASARRAVLYFSIFPTAYFLHAAYTESLFLCLSVGAFYYARRGRWRLAGIFGLFASMARVPGLLLLPALLTEYVLQKREESARIDRSILNLLLVLAGAAAIPLVSWGIYGNPLEFQRAQKVYWSQVPAAPWTGFLHSIESLHWRAPAQALTVGLAEATAGALFIAFALYALRHLRASYAVYAVLTAGVVTSTSFWLSRPRYLLALFPIFLVCARWGRRPVVHFLFVTCGILLYGLGLSLFVRGAWAF